MLNRDCARDHQRSVVYELQRVLLNAVCLVNQLLAEISAEPAGPLGVNSLSRAPEPSGGEPVEAEVAPDVSSTYTIGQLGNVEGPLGNRSPRDLP
jgi:hypothetical protein